MANEENLIPFKKGQSGNPNGRPRKTYSVHIAEIKKMGYEAPTKTEYFDLVSLLLAMTEDDLKEFAEDQERPYWIRVLITDLNNKKTRSKLMTDYRDWLFGKAKQNLELDASIDGELTITRRVIVGDSEKPEKT
jgi:hypothetical protein